MNTKDSSLGYNCALGMLYHCFVCVFVVGFITYAYHFTSSNLSFDSLIASNLRLDEMHKLSIGRFSQVLNHNIRGFVAAPWIVATLSLTWYSFCLYLISRIFNIKSRVNLCVIAALFLTYPDLIRSHTSFFHEIDNFALAHFMAVLSAYLIINKPFRGASLLASLCIAMLCGFYIPYISVVPTLFLLKLIKDIFEKKAISEIFKSVGGFVVYCVFGGLLYLLIYKTVLFVNAIEANSGYNSMDKLMGAYGGGSLYAFIYEFFFSYYMAAVNLLSPFTFHRDALRYVNLLIVLIAVFSLFRHVILAKLTKAHCALLFVVLILIVPSIFLARILALGLAHEGTRNGEVYLFVFLLLLSILYSSKSEESISNIDRIAPYTHRAMLLLLMLGVFSNWVLANRLFYRKELIATTTHSFFTRILHDIERHPQYSPSVTPVVVVGMTALSPYLRERTEYEEARNFPFMSPTIIENENDFSLGLYFNYHLGSNIRVENVTHEDEAPDFSVNMPIFPKEGSVKFVDGTLYVKVSDLLGD